MNGIALRFFPRFLVALLAISLLGACSARRTANELANAPQALRLAAHGDIETPLRWRLPNGARVALAHEGEVPMAWYDAAEQGFATVFPAAAAPGFTMHVYWPPHVQQREPDSAMEFALLGVDRLKPQREGRLRVVLSDVAGRPVLERTLHVRPVAFGAPWHAPVNLERAFEDLARYLTAG